ncbi:MAG: hypothetical protein IK082_12915 [Oscillospiraceae bacterium]|nr:hypothetical protein [Oscillospiraceae bacterium]
MLLYHRIVAFFASVLAFFSAISYAFGNGPADRGEWLLEGIPAFCAGIYSSALYNTGTGLDHERISSETPEIDPAFSYMQLISRTTKRDVKNYLAVLAENGYAETFRGSIEDNEAYGYEKDGSRVYVYFNAYSGETRVIDDCCNTVSLADFSYCETVSGEAAQPGVYQFSYPYTDAEHPDETIYGNSGMMYIILLSDGKIVIIDGGEYKHSTDKNTAELYRFLRELTGNDGSSPVEIALWYCTHCHSDHMYLFNKLLHDYHDKLVVERLMFNFQPDSIIEKEASVTDLLHFIERYCPDAAYVKARSGYSFRLQDAFFEVLYVQEDAVDAKDASWSYTNANDVSAVLRVTVGGKTFLFLGDSNQIPAEILLKKYTWVTLRADVLQAAHHLYNDLPRLYKVIRPKYVFCPQSKLRAETEPMAAYETLRRLVPQPQFFFAGDGIVYGLTPMKKGGFLISETPVDCVPYDGTYNC